MKKLDLGSRRVTPTAVSVSRLMNNNEIGAASFLTFSGILQQKRPT